MIGFQIAFERHHKFGLTLVAIVAVLEHGRQHLLSDRLDLLRLEEAGDDEFGDVRISQPYEAAGGFVDAEDASIPVRHADEVAAVLCQCNLRPTS
ncbi:hypothetical protein [Aurantimonas sp. NFXS3]|uniref:hypothetical protein n=1 Tax=Aurantimonas sp. NFXS3 TaxID=2818434 RepID=UPI003B8CFCBB